MQKLFLSFLLLVGLALPVFAVPTAVAWTTSTAPYWATSYPTIGASFDSSGTHTNTLYATGSINASTCAWTNISGPNTPTITSPTSCTSTTVTGIIASTAAANYVFRLTVTDSMAATDHVDLQVGAVPRDANDNIVPSDPNVTKLFGPLKAFGYNPWSYEDSQNLSAILQSETWWPANYSINWATPNTSGSISSWPFYAKGFNPGAAGTTLSADITSSATSIGIADARNLTMTSLPTWILVGNFGYGSGSMEMMRITACTSVATGMACTGATVAATLTVGYDGRGMSGNFVDVGGYHNGDGSPWTVVAQAWTTGTAVGEMRIQGSGTLFSTDATQALAPAGVPGPPGVIVTAASTGTVTMANVGGFAVLTASSGTPFTVGNGLAVGEFARVAATHASGTPYVFWGQITAFTNTTLTLNRPVPSGSDASAFSFKITDHEMYLALQYNSNTNGDMPQILQNGVGCESETACFALPVHDIPAFDAVLQTGSLKYSYKTNIGEVARPNATSAWAYYGVGQAGRSFWYRSGLSSALTLANYIDEHICRDPEIGDGFIPIQTLSIGGAVVGCLIDKILNGSTTLAWTNLEQFGRNAIGTLVPSGVPNACNITDTREGAYPAAWLTHLANYDPQATDPSQDFVTGLTNVVARDVGTVSFPGCLRNASDGYTGSEVNSFANSFVFSPGDTQTTTPLTLTNGATTVTPVSGTFNNSGLNGGPYCYGQDIITLTVTNGSSLATVASGTLTQQDLIYFYDGSMIGVFQYTGSGTAGASVQLAGVWRGSSGTFSAMSTGGGPLVSGGQRSGGYSGILAQVTPATPPVDNFANNRALEQFWACKYNNSTSLTLFRNWDRTSTSGLSGTNYYLSIYNIGSFGVQPFTFGIKTSQMRWCLQSTIPAIAVGCAAMAPLMGGWYNSNGWDVNNEHGTYYNVVPAGCGSQADVPAGSFDSIHGFEGCGAAGTTANALQESRFFSGEGGTAMREFYLANPTPARKAIVDTFYGAIVGLSGTCAAAVSSTCDGTVAYHLDDASFALPRYVGYYFGMGGFFMNTWPAVRDMSLAELCNVFGGGPCNALGGVSFSGGISFSGKVRI